MSECLLDNGNVPLRHQYLVKPLVPEKPTGEEGSRGDSSIEGSWKVALHIYMYNSMLAVHSILYSGNFNFHEIHNCIKQIINLHVMVYTLFLIDL